MNNEMVFAIADILKTRKGIFGINMDYCGEVTGLRKTDARAAGFMPENLRKFSHIENLIFGWNYESACAGRAEGGEYHALPLKGMRWVQGYEDFIASSLDGKTLYLRGYVTKSTRTVTQYMYGNRFATDDETESIKKCITPPKACAKQLAYGIENEVKPRMFKFSGIIGMTVPAQR